MSSTFLNPVEFAVGTVFTFTNEFASWGRPLLRSEFAIENGFSINDKYEVVEIKSGGKMDYETELDEFTIGATKIKNLRTGFVFDIENEYLDEKDSYWSFISSQYPDLFFIVKELK